MERKFLPRRILARATSNFTLLNAKHSQIERNYLVEYSLYHVAYPPIRITEGRMTC